MNDRMQQKRAPAARWAVVDPILFDGQLGIETDTGVIKVGDGVSTWSNLPIAFSSQYLPVLGAAADSHKLGGHDPSYFLPASGKAADSDLLDGLDSTAFLRANAKAADSDLLDGLDSTAFLRANAKAVDSELLDGLDSTSFALASSLLPNKRVLVSQVATASTTLALTDEGKQLTFNGAAGTMVLTLPANATVPFPVGGWVDVANLTTLSNVRISPAVGVTIRTPVPTFDLRLVDQYAVVRLLKIDTDTWMPIAGTIDTGNQNVNCTAPWPGTAAWRVKNGWGALDYIGSTSGATPAASTILTLPVGARPNINTHIASVYGDTLHEININATFIANPGVVSLNKAQSGGTGVAFTAIFPVFNGG
jgi:hypothetical protein